MEGTKGLEKLIGRTIKKIYFNENYLKFETDLGNLVFTVDGDCCSHSVFYDFYGVKKLLKGNKVVGVKKVDLKSTDIITEDGEDKDKKSYQESISVYGYQIFTIDKKFGELTSVFSFRNYSNGYYGGWMEETQNKKVMPEIFDDIVESAIIE